MLNIVEIRGFRCFLDLRVELKPLTVLIGPNDSGKSAFFDALNTLGGLSQVQDSDVCMFLEPGQKGVDILATHGEIPDQWRVVVREKKPRNEILSGPRPGELQRFQLPNQGVCTQCPGYGESERKILDLGSDGSRTAALIDHLLRTDLKRFLAFKDQLCKMVPGCKDVRIETPEPQLRRIDLEVERGHVIQASQKSAGVRLLLFFLALVHHPRPPKIVLIEEPENGIHPRRLAEVMQLLRGLTEGAFGTGKVQVIVTTHSPYLLDCVNLESDQVLIFERQKNGTRTAVAANRDHLQQFFEGFMLGEVWFNAEELGLTGPKT